MKKWMHRIEVLADRSIPYALILLLLLIIGEVFFADKIKSYSLIVSVFDWVIITIFVVDLSFKYARSKNIPDFLKTHWLEVLAVFPAFLLVRIIEEFFQVANLEQTVLLSQEAAEIEAKAGTRASRMHYFTKFIPTLSRLPRFLKAFSFYERPHHHHRLFSTKGLF